MYTLEKAQTAILCDGCGLEIAAGESYGRTEVGDYRHCGRCAIRLGAAELRASLEGIRDRIERLS